MHIQTYEIIPALQPYIKLICTMACDHDTDTNTIRVLPDTCVELFFNYTSTPVAIIGDEIHNGSIITSRMCRPVDVQMRKGAGVIALCFHPGMAYRFIQVPMHTLSDTTVALADIGAGMITTIEEKMAGLPDNESRVRLVQEYLYEKLTDTPDNAQISYCLRQAQLSGGSITVGKLADDTGLSQRQLSRKFREYVGISPKEYLRVSRFVLSLEHLEKYSVLSLTDIAYKSGYYDQAHFIRDYKQYTGYTPGQVVRDRRILY